MIRALPLASSGVVLRRLEAACFGRQNSIGFGVLGVLVVAAFAFGGSARSDVAALIVLRPVAAIALGVGVWRLRVADLRTHRFLAVMGVTVTGLPALQLIPLPFAVWSKLPGREMIAAIDAAAGIGRSLRPLTMTPDATRNSLLSLLIPLAILILGIALAPRQRARLLPLLLCLGAVSAMLGLVQTLTWPSRVFYFYDITNGGSPVGFFANRNHQAVFLAMMLPMLATWATTGTGPAPIRRLVAVLGGLLLAPLILITGSRAGLVCGGLGISTIPLLLPRPRLIHVAEGPKSGGLVRPLVVQLGAFMLISVAACAAIATVWSGRGLAWDRIVSRGPEIDGRVVILPSLLKAIALYFPWGSGAGSFEDIFALHEPDALLGPSFMNHAHNDWLEVLLTMGASGAIVLFVVAAALVMRSVTALAEASAADPETRLARLGLIIIWIAGVASLTDYPLRTPAFSAIFVLAAFWASAPLPSRTQAGRVASALPAAAEDE